MLGLPQQHSQKARGKLSKLRKQALEHGAWQSCLKENEGEKETL